MTRKMNRKERRRQAKLTRRRRKVQNYDDRYYYPSHRQTQREVEFPFGLIDVVDRDFLPLWVNENLSNPKFKGDRMKMLTKYFDQTVGERWRFVKSKIGSLSKFYDRPTLDIGNHLEKLSGETPYEFQRHYLRLTYPFLDELYPGDHTEKVGNVTTFTRLTLPEELWNEVLKIFDDKQYCFWDERQNIEGILAFYHHTLDQFLERD